MAEKRSDCLKNGNNNQGDKTMSAVELAILNGIEAYNREQQAKKQSAGEMRTPEAMEEAGLKPRRRSRAKGKGTNLPAKSASAAPVPRSPRASPPQRAVKRRTRPGTRSPRRRNPPSARKRAGAKSAPSRCSSSAAWARSARI